MKGRSCRPIRLGSATPSTEDSEDEASEAAALAALAARCSSAAAAPEARSTASARASADADSLTYPFEGGRRPPTAAVAVAGSSCDSVGVGGGAPAGSAHARHARSTPNAMAPGSARKAADRPMWASLVPVVWRLIV